MFDAGRQHRILHTAYYGYAQNPHQLLTSRTVSLLNGQLFQTMAIKELHFITGNRNKLAEVQSIIGSVIPLKNQSLDLVEIQGTIEDISKDKCRRAAEKVWQ